MLSSPRRGRVEARTGSNAPPGQNLDRFRRRLPAFSHLGRLILGLNLVGLAVLAVGGLALNESRRGLIEARLDSLNTQGEFIANVLDRAATSGDPAPELDADLASQTLQLLFIPRSQRARLFDREGRLIADSYVVDDRIEERPLPPPRKRGEKPSFWPRLLHMRGDPARLAARSRDALSTEVRAAMNGKPVAAVRIASDGQRRVSVSIPIQHVKAVLGVLTLEGGEVDKTVWAQRKAFLPFVLIAGAATLLSSLLLNTLVAWPILRLERAADAVRLAGARAISLPDLAGRQDEVGGLARALEAMTDAQSARMGAIERFAADVAHEIKNPLTSMRSAVETLEIAPPDSPHRGRLTGILKADLKRLDRLITDIANASRLDAELSRDSLRPVDLGRLLTDIAETYDGRPGATVRLVEPETLDGFVVSGREGPLGQVFRNLIDNARAFSPPGAEVRVTLGRTPGRDGARRAVAATVDDDGPGVPPENLESIFERFYTSRPKTVAEPGGAAFGGHSGLGLSIARQIVAAQGGVLSAENRLDAAGAVAGARFTAGFPEPLR